VDREADLDARWTECWSPPSGTRDRSARLLAAIVDEAVYDEFLLRLARKVEAIRVGPADSPDNYMGPVINEGARRSILKYIEIGKTGGAPGGRAAERPKATATSYAPL